MSNDKTLATAKHGGCVQLGGKTEPSFNWKEGVHDEASLRLAGKAWDNLMYEDSAGEYTPAQHDQIGRMLVNVEQMMEGHPFTINEEGQYVAKEAALSAQPSPGGQGDALDCIGRIEEAIEFRVPHDIYAAVHGDLAELKAVIAARQPVGQITDAEIDARLNALYREMVDSGQHNGGMSGVAWDRAVFRMASKQLAQTVDLDSARHEGHDCAIRYVLGYLNGTGDLASTQYGEILNGCGRESIIRSAIRDGELEFTGLGQWVAKYGTDAERALIDSQAVGK